MKKEKLAELVARGAHKGQKYGGYDYDYHLEMVVGMARFLYPESPKLGLILQGCWLHDVVEDTDLSLDDLRDMGFHHEVVKAVSLVTKDEKYVKDKHFLYLASIAQDNLAFKVKVADTMANLQQNVREGNYSGVRKYTIQLKELHEAKSQRSTHV
ncbi:hypothetical protein VspSw1_94 [Vibrio phage VspSw_1]|uniref:Phosphohydrolase n=1 Tax=Vibrio phage VspSw_1 TaxID=2484249 RepID=A0A411BKN2_9CAUD|nr:metal-dependent phosphohydrolase [Vibrio phage VspSw_1]QAY02164.1 hypothetical protein VspSw1_94 [Vibrio phage VspSw_1]